MGINRAFLTILLHAVLATASGNGRPLIVMDNAFNSGETVEQQATLLHQLGFEGFCTRPKYGSASLYQSFEQKDLPILATYVVLPVRANGEPIPESIQEHIRGLKGRNTVIWLSLTNAKAKEEDALRVIRSVCALAAENELEVALYPHVRFYTDTVATCKRLWEQADCQNLGLSFTLCHFLCQNDAATLEETIRSIAPQLKLVQVNGANVIPPGKPDWKQLIQPLGAGDFDVGPVFQVLDAIGYDGPVCLQSYNIQLSAEKHLTLSKQTWDQYHE